MKSNIHGYSPLDKQEAYEQGVEDAEKKNGDVVKKIIAYLEELPECQAIQDAITGIEKGEYEFTKNTGKA